MTPEERIADLEQQLAAALEREGTLREAWRYVPESARLAFVPEDVRLAIAPAADRSAP